MKSPAFQFYPSDYLGSQRVQMMSLEEEGAYCRLLWSCWQHGSIPSDPNLAARLVGKGCTTAIASSVLPMFEMPCGEGRVTHDRLEAERAKQAEWREKSAAGGRKSGEARKGSSTTLQPPFNHPSTTLGTKDEPKGNTPTPSPSSSPTTRKKAAPSLVVSSEAEAADPTRKWLVGLGLEMPDALRTLPCMEAARTWLLYKREKGDSYKAIGLKAALGKWAKDFTPATFPEAVENSMALNYRGIFPSRDFQQRQEASSPRKPETIFDCL